MPLIFELIRKKIRLRIFNCLIIMPKKKKIFYSEDEIN